MSERSQRTSRRLALVAIALLAALFLRFGIHTLGPWANDQGVKRLQVRVLLESRFGAVAFPDRIHDLDPDGTWSPLPRMFTWEHDGRRYCVFSILHALAVAPFAGALGPSGVFVVPVVGMLLAAWAAGRLARRAAPATPGWVAPLALALATPMGFYAFVLWEHALAAGILLAGFEAFVASRMGAGAGAPHHPGLRLGALLPGLAVGVSFGLRPEAIVLVPAFAAGMFGIDRRVTRWLPAFAGGLALALAPLFILNHFLYGAPLGPDLSFHYDAIGNRPFLAHLMNLRGGLAREWLLDGGTRVWVLAAAAVLAAAFALRRRLASAWLFPLLALAAAGAFLGPRPNHLHRDLWSSAPVLLLALFAPAALVSMPAATRRGAGGAGRAGTSGTATRAGTSVSRGALRRALAAVVVVYLAGAIATAPNDGGAQWGARYLLPIVPVLLLLGLGAAESWLAATGGIRRIAVAGGVAALCGFSLFVQARGLGVLARTTRDGAELLRVVRRHSTDVVVADSGYVCHLLGSLYLDRRIMLAEKPSALRDLAGRLRERGIERWTYVAGMPWGKSMALENRAGLRCDAAAFLAPYGLLVFDCDAAATASKE